MRRGLLLVALLGSSLALTPNGYAEPVTGSPTRPGRPRHLGTAAVHASRRPERRVRPDGCLLPVRVVRNGLVDGHGDSLATGLHRPGELLLAGDPDGCRRSGEACRLRRVVVRPRDLCPSECGLPVVGCHVRANRGAERRHLAPRHRARARSHLRPTARECDRLPPPCGGVRRSRVRRPLRHDGERRR